MRNLSWHTHAFLVAVLALEAQAVHSAPSQVSCAEKTTADECGDRFAASMEREMRLNKYTKGIVCAVQREDAFAAYRWSAAQLKERARLESENPWEAQTFVFEYDLLLKSAMPLEEKYRDPLYCKGVPDLPG